jgi:Domain of unknown function (DUF4919)
MFRAVVVYWTFWLYQSVGIAAQQDDAAYHVLVQRVSAGDMTIDFRALRLACIKASDCEPRATPTDLHDMTSAAENHVLETSVEIGETLVAKGFVNIEAHLALATAYGQMNQPVKAKFHMDVTTALMRSIFLSGNGKTKETAFEVVCDREEYVMMAAIGLPAFGPSVAVGSIVDGIHKFETREALDPKTGNRVKVFFNVDAYSPTKSRPSVR